jgi:hypothetical protein
VDGAGVTRPKDGHLAEEIPSCLANGQETDHPPCLLLDEELGPIRVVVEGIVGRQGIPR